MYVECMPKVFSEKLFIASCFTVAFGFYVAGFLLIFCETRGLGNLVIILIFIDKMERACKFRIHICHLVHNILSSA